MHPSLRCLGLLLYTLSAITGCGGEVGGESAERDVEGAHAAHVSFAWIAPSVCVPECAEAQPIAVGARTLLVAKGLPPYSKVHARLSASSTTILEGQTTVWQCWKETEQSASLRRIDEGGPPCAADESPRTVHQVILKAGAEGDELLELVDDATNDVVDAMTVRARVPTRLVANVELQPSTMQPGPALTRGAGDVIEVPIGAGLFVKPIAYAGFDALAFHDGIAITAAPHAQLSRVTEPPNGEAFPPAGSGLLRATSAGDATFTLELGTLTHTQAIRVVP